MGTRAKKGSKFERETCRRLSLWWSKGEHDDLFWRSSNSGGRATVRGRQGKRTQGQAGDIAATCPTAEPLLRAFTLELKKGYATTTIHDVLDKHPTFAHQDFDKWVIQARESADTAGSLSWWLITNRDRRLPLLWMPNEAWRWHLDISVGRIERHFSSICQVKTKVKGDKVISNYVGLPFEEYLQNTNPHTIKRILINNE